MMRELLRRSLPDFIYWGSLLNRSAIGAGDRKVKATSDSALSLVQKYGFRISTLFSPEKASRALVSR